MGLKSSAFRDASCSSLFLLLPFLIFWDLAKLVFSLLESLPLPDTFPSCSPLLLFPVCALKRSARQVSIGTGSWHSCIVLMVQAIQMAICMGAA